MDHRKVAGSRFCYTAQNIELLIELLILLNTLIYLFADINFNKSDSSIIINFSFKIGEKIFYGPCNRKDPSCQLS